MTAKELTTELGSLIQEQARIRTGAAAAREALAVLDSVALSKRLGDGGVVNVDDFVGKSANLSPRLKRELESSVESLSALRGRKWLLERKRTLIVRQLEESKRMRAEKARELEALRVKAAKMGLLGGIGVLAWLWLV